MQVDVVLGGGWPDDEFFARARRRRIDGILVPVAAAEDIIVMKILASRAKDIEDVKSMLRSKRTNADLQEARLLLGRLERALDPNDLVQELDGLVRQARRRR